MSTPNLQTKVDPFIRLPQVKAMTGLGRTSIYEYIRAGDFPRQYKISRRMVAWKLSEVQGWIDSQQRVGGDV